MALISYPMQLQELARKRNVPLLDAVKVAALPTSTYYRSVVRTDIHLRFDTAERIADAIEQIAQAR